MPDLVDYNKPHKREKLFTAYRNNIVTYLRLKYPDDDPQIIMDKVTAYIDGQCQLLRSNLATARVNDEDLNDLPDGHDKVWPTVDCVFHEDEYGAHTPGNIRRETSYDLVGYVQKYDEKILTPYGSVYELPEVMPSHLGIMQDELKGKRGVDKKKMLNAKRDGDRVKAQHYHNTSNSTKYVMNSIPGNMGAPYHVISSVANFNSVTSVSRQVIMRAYSHMEKFLASNFYFTTVEEVINFIIICYRLRPTTISETIRKFDIYVPSVDDVYDFLVAQLHKYCIAEDRPQIRDLINSIDEDTRTFIFYMSNMFHLMKFNPEYFKQYYEDFFNEDIVDMTVPCKPGDLAKLDGDLLIVISTMYRNEIPRNEKGNNVSIYDTIEQEPELAKKLYRVGVHCQGKIDAIKLMFDTFINHHIATPNVLNHKHMFRYCVVNSDTDSVLFTTKDWIEWFTGSLAMSDAGLKMNALTVYFASKANMFVMFDVSRALGATGKNLFKLAMKNEFFMPVEILNNAKKHYFSIVAMQEGVYYGTPEADIKGVGFRGSDTSRATAGFTRWMQLHCIQEIMDTGKITMHDKITSILKFERLVYDSVIDGTRRFLKLKPVRHKEDYSNPEGSIYFNYSLWEEVFAPKYGTMTIPNKGYILPINPDSIRSKEYMCKLEAMDSDMAMRLRNFLDRCPANKKISYIVLNPATTVIPKEAIPLANLRKIIYDSVRPVHLALSCIGLPLGSNKTNLLYSDTYGWVTKQDSLTHEQYLGSE